MTTSARIHRFGSKVAIRIGGNETVYLTASLTQSIARKLAECALDIEHVPEHKDSEFVTWNSEEESNQ